MTPDQTVRTEILVLDGINRIFREALSAASEEELGQLCLAVAEDLTSATFSFMGEIDAGTGRLDDLVVSRRAAVGGDAAAQDGTLPGGVAIGGLFEDVVRGRASLLANDPPGPADEDGLRAWHPPLDSFLGVPLVENDECFGMIGLGNRPGGFREADRAIVEALSPAIVHALRRKRADARHRESERRLRTLVDGVPQLVWRAAPAGWLTWVSPQWLAYTGQTVEESLGEGWLAVIHPDDRASARAIWQAAPGEGRLAMDARIRNAADGRYRWFQTRATPVRDEGGAIVEWLGTSTDVDDLRRLQDRQQVLVGELQHRVRNILTVVRSVFCRTVEADGPLEEIVDHFKGRLDSLARTQVIVTQSSSGWVDLEHLVRDELLSVGAGDGPALTVDGPKIALNAKAAESIGLVIHELTTNAIKYGALRTAGAALSIRWTVGDAGDGRRLDLNWTERGMPVMPMERRRYGFGSELIEEALPYQLGAETRMEMRGGGLRCVISVPVRAHGAMWREG